MPISRAELKSFTQLYNSFLRFANAKLQIVGTDPEPNDLMALRDAVFDDRKWIDRFVKAKPCWLSSNELATVSSWHNAQAGNFYVIRVLKSYAVFMGCGKNYEPTEHLYAVLHTVPFDRVLGIDLPVVVKTVLLPFEGKIVCDGMISFHNIDLGDEVRGGLDGCFAFIKARRGLIRSLSTPPLHTVKSSSKRRGGKSR